MMEPAEYEQRVATLEGSMTTMAQTVERVSKTVGEVNKKVEQLSRDMPTLTAQAAATAVQQERQETHPVTVSLPPKEQQERKDGPEYTPLHKMKSEICKYAPTDKFDIVDHIAMVVVELHGWKCDPVKYPEQAKEVLFTSLGTELKRNLMMIAPSRAYRDHNFEEYAAVIKRLLLGADSVGAAMARWEAVQQDKEEPILSFLTRMQNAASKAFCGELGGNLSRFFSAEAWKNELLKRLRNPLVREQLIFRKHNTMDDVTADVLELTAMVQRAVRNRCASQTSTEGLGQFNKNFLANNTVWRKPDEPMEVDSIHQLSAQLEGAQLYEEQEGEGYEAEEINAIQQGGGVRPRICWDCGLQQHLSGSPSCPEPGAGKFRPAFVRGRGGAWRGRGGYGQNQGFKGNYNFNRGGAQGGRGNLFPARGRGTFANRATWRGGNRGGAQGGAARPTWRMNQVPGQSLNQVEYELLASQIEQDTLSGVLSGTYDALFEAEGLNQAEEETEAESPEQAHFLCSSATKPSTT